MVGGIMKEISSLIEKNEYFTAWRLIKSLPEIMQVSVIDDVLMNMAEGKI